MTDQKSLGHGSKNPAVFINHNLAESYQSLVGLGVKRRQEKKYNIKLMRQDYEVIKLASEAEGRSASYFVSFLVYDHVARELARMAGESRDALLLIAASADAETDYDIMSTPWIYDVMSDELEEIVAAVIGSRDAELGPLMEMIEQYSMSHSHLHKVVKLAIGA